MSVLYVHCTVCPVQSVQWMSVQCVVCNVLCTVCIVLECEMCWLCPSIPYYSSNACVHAVRMHM